ncbi:MAG: PadR family transcriptional regulator [Longimicrobiales bacterium]|nr:PadR family transcriptional regulator [Longimicrobiales bacterium]
MDTSSEPRVEDLLPLTHVVYYVLLSLSHDERHGYGIIKDVRDRTDGELELEAGTLYAAIKRLRDDGLIDEASAPADADARRRYYRLTPLGLRVLQAESRRLHTMVELARQARVLPSA